MNEQYPTTPVLHTLEVTEKTTVPVIPVVLGGIILILAGIMTGYRYSQSSLPGAKSTNSIVGSDPRKIFGAPDTKSFRDSTDGILKADGTEGEGTHRLIRPGGDDQTVYLTSSILDLNQFVDKKVRVWGETFAAKKAGWFMDVGRVELLD